MLDDALHNLVAEAVGGDEEADNCYLRAELRDEMGPRRAGEHEQPKVLVVGDRHVSERDDGLAVKDGNVLRQHISKHRIDLLTAVLDNERVAVADAVRELLLELSVGLAGDDELTSCVVGRGVDVAGGGGGSARAAGDAAGARRRPNDWAAVGVTLTARPLCAACALVGALLGRLQPDARLPLRIDNVRELSRRINDRRRVAREVVDGQAARLPLQVLQLGAVSQRKVERGADGYASGCCSDYPLGQKRHAELMREGRQARDNAGGEDSVADNRLGALRQLSNLRRVSDLLPLEAPNNTHCSAQLCLSVGLLAL